MGTVCRARTVRKQSLRTLRPYTPVRAPSGP